MAKFKITWVDGSVEEVNQNDCLTVSQYINCRFGTMPVSAKVELADVVDAVIVEPEAPVVEAPVVEAPVVE